MTRASPSRSLPTATRSSAGIINSTEAQTTVQAVDGQTVVLSGLLTRHDEALHRRVPLIADVPLIGAVFRFDSSRQVRTELLIVLTPRVIRGRAEAERLKHIESSRMSWCLSDVVDLHGPAGLRSRTDMLVRCKRKSCIPICRRRNCRRSHRMAKAWRRGLRHDQLLMMPPQSGPAGPIPDEALPGMLPPDMAPNNATPPAPPTLTPGPP